MKDKKTIYILSDGTGETAGMMVRAALVQYKHQDVHIVKSKNIRTDNQLEPLFEEVESQKGMIVFTIVSQLLRSKIIEMAKTKNIPAVDLLGPLLLAIDAYFGNAPIELQAGLLHVVDDKYFKRIEAIEYTVKHDDGKILTSLSDADIILVGISRTSKTPLSIFLSHKGFKVANVPIVLGQELPEILQEVDQRKIVGLAIDADTLMRIRRRRLEKFGQDPGSEYASREHIFKEIEFANALFKQNRRWPIFNVTDRALEEMVAEIVRIVAARMDLPYDLIL